MLKEVRSVVDKYPGDPVLVTEADEPNVAGADKDVWQWRRSAAAHGLPDRRRQRALRAALPRALQRDRKQLAPTASRNTSFRNHDQPRQWDRYGDGEHNDQIAKLMAVLELTTRGTPQMYYGEELGMRTTDPARIEDVHDPIGKLGWPKEKGRDGERTPMQWDASAEAGFTTAKPWLPIPPSASTVQRRSRKQGFGFDLQHLQAASGAAQDRTGLARWHRRSLSTKPIPMSSRFSAEAATRLYWWLLNMSDQPRIVKFDWTKHGVRWHRA